eukprot:751228-Hanusia_phi.AAC.1
MARRSTSLVWVLLATSQLVCSQDESAECFVAMLHPTAFSQVDPSLLDVRACSNCGGQATQLLVSLDGHKVSVPFEVWRTNNASCPTMVHAKLRGMQEGNVRVGLCLGFGEGSDRRLVSSDVVLVRSSRPSLKRFLFLLHVDSLWRLGEMEGEMRTRDSDVVTVVCSPPMEEEERKLFAENELEFLISNTNFQHPSTCGELLMVGGV